jgi:hypothetical protein
MIEHKQQACQTGNPRSIACLMRPAAILSNFEITENKQVQI